MSDMHDSMQYDPIKDQNHEPFKVGNPTIFKHYLLLHLGLQWESHCRPKWRYGSWQQKRPLILKLGHNVLTGPDF